MRTLLLIAFRNLWRQKRRSILLGSAIAIGTAVLVLASSFSQGISRVLFDRIVVYVSGHASVVFAEKGRGMSQIMRDGSWVIPRLAALPGVKRVEQSIGVFCRVVGDHRADNLIMVGVDLKQKYDAADLQETEENFPMTVGSFYDLKDSTVENPVILSEGKAKYLDAHKGDILRIRYRDINDHPQAARLTVVGIFRPSNIFMEAPMFLELQDTRRLLGFGAQDIPNLYITLYHPEQDAKRIADQAQQILSHPPQALLVGLAQATAPSIAHKALLQGFAADSVSLLQWKSKISVDSLPGIDTIPELRRPFGREGVLIHKALAAKLGLKALDTLEFRYLLHHKDTLSAHPDTALLRLRIAGLVSGAGLDSNAILWHEITFYDQYLAYPPLPSAAQDQPLLVADTLLASKLTKAWHLLPRAATTDEMQKNVREVGRGKYRGTAVEVRTMYEAASDVLKLEGALNLITFSAVLIIFLVVLVGVVNTLRMTIRERTREIGTMRAIGMQGRDVHISFLLETGMLAFFSASFGVILSLLAQWGISLITFNTQGNPLGLILVRGHVQFNPTIAGVAFTLALIVFLSLVAAWFPSRRAARLSPTEALRHHE